MTLTPSDAGKERTDLGVLVIGGGAAGMASSLALARLGHRVELVERSPALGGRASRLSALFPDLRPASGTAEGLIAAVESEERITVRTSREIVSLSPREKGLLIELDDGSMLASKAIVLATGLDEVPPTLVPEYGHGVKDGVVTSIELEEMLRTGKVAGRSGSRLRSAVFVQCVGSRTERRGVPYCSALCCANAVKNALALKRLDPTMEVTVLYIDLRTTGLGQESLYREARRSGVRFIRGQPSLVMVKGGELLVCGENTLLRELYEVRADLVVLSTGLRQSPQNLLLMDSLGVRQGYAGFPAVESGIDGVFLCGSAKGPMDLPTAIADARSCALAVHSYMDEKKGK
jgi:heterodisulfide reductase subunit A-like polyferredoxin